MISSHKTPRFMLAQFSFEMIQGKKKHRLIWVYEKGKKARKGSPREEQSEEGYFARVGPSGVDESMEKFLADTIEAPWNSKLLPLLLGGSAPSKEQLEQMARYVAILFGRSQARKRASHLLNEQVAIATEELLGNLTLVRAVVGAHSVALQRRIPVPAITGSLKRYADRSAASVEARNAFVDTLLPAAEKVAEVLSSRRWSILTAPDTCSFITSDNPVITRIRVGNSYSLGWGFNRDGLEVLFPLNPSNCLIVGNSAQSRVATAEEVGLINRNLISCIDQKAYSRDFSEQVERWTDEFGGEIKYMKNGFIPPFEVSATLLANFLIRHTLTNLSPRDLEFAEGAVVA